jgi:hypothetical protein
MPEIVKFKAFCLERYKYEHNLSGKETIHRFKEYEVMDYIGSFYDVIHTFGDNYIVEDIDLFIRTRQPV